MRIVFLLLTAFLTSVSVQQVRAADTLNAETVKNGNNDKDEELILEDETGNTPAPVKSEQKVSTSKPQNDFIKADTTKLNKNASNKATKVNQEDDVLILDGEEEDILSGQQVKPVKPAPVKVTVTDSGKTVPKSSSDTTSVAKISDSSKTVSQDSIQKPVDATPVLPKPQQLVEKAPEKIEQEQSINFARNLTEYRSPRVAMMLSLLVPGAGQEYAKNHLKAGLFGAVEVAIISVGAAFNVKGSKELKKAHDFADNHYSVENFSNYYSNLAGHFQNDSTGILENIFYGQEKDTFINDATRKTENYYKTIREGSNPFVNGWDDAKPGFDENFDIKTEDASIYAQYTSKSDPKADSSFLVYKKSDSTNVQYGFSENQKKYSDMVGKSGTYYRVSRGVFISLLVNHLLSALDAGITAKAYNDKLLGKQSVWQRLNIKENDVSIGDRTLTGYALQVRF